MLIDYQGTEFILTIDDVVAVERLNQESIQPIEASHTAKQFIQHTAKRTQTQQQEILLLMDPDLVLAAIRDDLKYSEKHTDELRNESTKASGDQSKSA